MSSAARRPHYSIEEYLALERISNVRHEYLDGDIFAMAGGTPEHAGTCASLIILLGNAVRDRPCRVYTSDVRVRVQATGLDTYPDISVVCGPVQMDKDDRNAIVNPVLLVEVTSPSSEGYDRGAKLDHYRRIPALREVVLVAHDMQRVDVWRRREDATWASESHGPGAVARLDSLGCELPVAEIYRNPLPAD
jgi:Uma2 family endonuclease